MRVYFGRIRFFSLIIGVIVHLLPFTSVIGQNSPSSSGRPNIIYIMADDLGYADLSSYGRKDYSTPNLDKLASEGIKFTNAYAAAPVCTPTRAGFMTGRYPARFPFGLREPMVASKKDSLLGLSPEIPSLPQLLRKAGYETALIGKWHLGFKREFAPNINGFDYFFGFRSGAADYVSHKGDGGRTYDLFENEKPYVENGYLTNMFAEKAVNFVEQKHDKPFFLCLTFNAPHWPWQAPGDAAYPDTMRWINGGSKATYALMMKSLDDAVSNVLNALDKKGLTNNTLVIFTSDNGGEKFSDMGVFTGKKLLLWEGGIRIPAFVKWPGKIKPNSTTDQPAITMDWTATILAAAGVNTNAQSLDGTNLLPLCTQKAKPFARTFYWRTIERSHQKAMREGNWKYLKDEKDEYLFDLSSDPSEKNNLREKNREIFDRMKSKYAAWEASVLKPDAVSQDN